MFLTVNAPFCFCVVVVVRLLLQFEPHMVFLCSDDHQLSFPRLDTTQSSISISLKKGSADQANRSSSQLIYTRPSITKWFFPPLSTNKHEWPHVCELKYAVDFTAISDYLQRVAMLPSERSLHLSIWHSSHLLWHRFILHTWFFGCINAYIYIYIYCLFLTTCASTKKETWRRHWWAVQLGLIIINQDLAGLRAGYCTTAVYNSTQL